MDNIRIDSISGDTREKILDALRENISPKSNWKQFANKMESLLQADWLDSLTIQSFEDKDLSKPPETLFRTWSSRESYTVGNLIMILRSIGQEHLISIIEKDPRLARLKPYQKPKEPEIIQNLNEQSDRPSEPKKSEVKRKIFVVQNDATRSVEIPHCTSLDQFVAHLRNVIKLNSDEFSVKYWDKEAEDWVVLDDLKQLSGAQKFKIFPEKYLQVVFGHMIGEGSFSKVYAGTWTGTEVVIKIFTNTDFPESYEKESQKHKDLTNPHILQFFGVCRDKDGNKGIVTEQTAGDLLLHLKKNIVQIGSFMKICRDIAAGMMYLNSCQIVHRDLAARNILLKQEGTNFVAKVADFGLSAGSQTLQTTNFKISTRWTAPEALKGNWTEKSDVWSFGVVLFEIYSYGQRVPYQGVNDEEAKKLIAAEKGPGYPDKCPKEICNIMDYCWKGNPEDRKDFQWLHDELKSLLLG